MPLRLRPDIATADTDDGLVLLDERTGRYWQLNPPAPTCWSSCSMATILTTSPRPCHPYRIDVGQAHLDVTAITDHLYTAKLVRSS
jgi:hypothetical protein